MLNGRKIKKKKKCDLCKNLGKAGSSIGTVYLLYEYNGKQICRTCGKKVKLL